MKIFNSTDAVFNSNGNITIKPFKCLETKKKSLNGWFIDVEVSSEYKDEIKQDMLCVVKTKSKLNPQAFRIKNPKLIGRKISFQAVHVMFDAENFFLVDVRPTSMSAQGALAYINDRTDKLSPFTITSDVSATQTAYFIRKNLLEAWSTIEERWGGSFDADNFNILLKSNIGNDNGDTLYYGKDIQGIEIYEDWSSVTTRIYPTGKDGMMLPEKYIDSEVQYVAPYTRTVQFDTVLEDEDQTEENLIAELRDNANNHLDVSKFPRVSYTIKSDVKQSLEIGDTVHVKHPAVNLTTEVQEYTYDINTHRVKSLTYGNYNRDVKKRFEEIKNAIAEARQQVTINQWMIGHQTELINSLNKNGYVYIDENEILILDLLPKEDAINVWRWGLGGIGFSSNGYEGPFEYAFTMDGHFNANFIVANSITTNHLAADVGSSLDISSNQSINAIVEGAQNYVDEEIQQLSTQMTQTNVDWLFQFTSIQELVEHYENGNQEKFNELVKYIRFLDGNIILGEVGNEITLTLENDILYFSQNGVRGAYFSEGKLYVYDGHFINSLRVGNFAFIPRSNGNLSFKKVGDS